MVLSKCPLLQDMLKTLMETHPKYIWDYGLAHAQHRPDAAQLAGQNTLARDTHIQKLKFYVNEALSELQFTHQLSGATTLPTPRMMQTQEFADLLWWISKCHLVHYFA